MIMYNHLCIYIYIYLVGGLNPSEKYKSIGMIIHDYSQYMEKEKKFQTTNQMEVCVGPRNWGPAREMKFTTRWWSMTCEITMENHQHKEYILVNVYVAMEHHHVYSDSMDFNGILSWLNRISIDSMCPTW